MELLVHGYESVVATTLQRFRKCVFTFTKALFITCWWLRFQKRICTFTKALLRTLFSSNAFETDVWLSQKGCLFFFKDNLPSIYWWRNDYFVIGMVGVGWVFRGFWGVVEGVLWMQWVLDKRDRGFSEFSWGGERIRRHCSLQSWWMLLLCLGRFCEEGNWSWVLARNLLAVL